MTIEIPAEVLEAAQSLKMAGYLTKGRMFFYAETMANWIIRERRKATDPREEIIKQVLSSKLAVGSGCIDFLADKIMEAINIMEDAGDALTQEKPHE